MSKGDKDLLNYSPHRNTMPKRQSSGTDTLIPPPDAMARIQAQVEEDKA
jgi:hypothetical protein